MPNQANNALLNQNAVRLRAKDGVSQPYLFYKLREDLFSSYLLNNAQGSANQASITLQDIFSYKFSLPPLPEQTAIASVLSSIDDKIDLLHRQNATLEAMAETLFRQWFVEEAKENWEVVSLADIAFFFNGKSRPNEEGTIPIYGGNGILGYTNKSNYTGKSIIIGRVGAYCGSLYYENKKIWVSDNALLVKAKNERHTHYLFFLLKTLDLNSMAQGSSHPLLTQTLLKSIEVSQPPKDKIEEFDGQFESWRNKIELNQTQIRTLTTLRDTLLPKLMSGEVRVKM